MAGRTFAVGDIHGDLQALETLLGKLPLSSRDTLVFIGDYVDRGPDSLGVVSRVRDLELNGVCRVIALRGNHEDVWARARDESQPGFFLHQANGCLATYRSFAKKPPLPPHTPLSDDDLIGMLRVEGWFPTDLAFWMANLRTWFEDEHAIYVHAGLDADTSSYLHPAKGRERPLLWTREAAFFRTYRGKRVVFGHTRTRDLPTLAAGQDGAPDDAYATTGGAPEVSAGEIPADMEHLGKPDEVWLSGDLIGLDTGAGMGGHLSAVELPSLTVYSSRLPTLVLPRP
jgi:serine/threonine protein phosphatase 1